MLFSLDRADYSYIEIKIGVKGIYGQAAENRFKPTA